MVPARPLRRQTGRSKLARWLAVPLRPLLALRQLHLLHLLHPLHPLHPLHLLRPLT